MACEPLTEAERKWLKDVQRVLNRCPSTRFGFYTIGDRDITVIDQGETDAYEAKHGWGDKSDYCSLVDHAETRLGDLVFPHNVHSTAG
jgi:hypothetical protein